MSKMFPVFQSLLLMKEIRQEQRKNSIASESRREGVQTKRSRSSVEEESIFNERIEIIF